MQPKQIPALLEASYIKPLVSQSCGHIQTQSFAKALAKSIWVRVQQSEVQSQQLAITTHFTLPHDQLFSA
jgi:hypothetical protein